MLIDSSPLLGSLQMKPMAGHIPVGYPKYAVNFWKDLARWVNSLLRFAFLQWFFFSIGVQDFYAREVSFTRNFEAEMCSSIQDFSKQNACKIPQIGTALGGLVSGVCVCEWL